MQKPFPQPEELENLNAKVEIEIADLVKTTNKTPGGVTFVKRTEPLPTPHPPEDPINPPHYRKHPSGIECIEVTRHMNFNVGNAIKYLWRYLDKGDPVENLKKAQWYLDDEIARLGGKR